MIYGNQEDAVEHAKAILAEHFDNFAIAVIGEDGDIYYDYSNPVIGKALFSESIQDMKLAREWQNEVIWDDDEED